MFTLGLRDLASTILANLAGFSKIDNYGLVFRSINDNIIAVQIVVQEPLLWMIISISHVCFKIFVYMATS